MAFSHSIVESVGLPSASSHRATPAFGALVFVSERLALRAGISGNGEIEGTVKRKGIGSDVPVVGAKVRLYRDRDGALIDSTLSGVGGGYAFVNLDRAYTYTALAYDSSGLVYRAVAGDGLIPTVMT